MLENINERISEEWDIRGKGEIIDFPWNFLLKHFCWWKCFFFLWPHLRYWSCLSLVLWSEINSKRKHYNLTPNIIVNIVNGVVIRILVNIRSRTQVNRALMTVKYNENCAIKCAINSKHLLVFLFCPLKCLIFFSFFEWFNMFWSI